MEPGFDFLREHFGHKDLPMLAISNNPGMKECITIQGAGLITLVEETQAFRPFVVDVHRRLAAGDSITRVKAEVCCEQYWEKFAKGVKDNLGHLISIAKWIL